jgi:hypothetical protein
VAVLEMDQDATSRSLNTARSGVVPHGIPFTDVYTVARAEELPMYDQDHDAIVEIDSALARIRVLSPQARDWIETHVTLEQAQTWAESVLEVAPHYIGDLLTGMLADGLKISTVRGQLLESRSHFSTDFFLTSASQN